MTTGRLLSCSTTTCSRSKARQRSAARSRLPDKPLDFQVCTTLLQCGPGTIYGVPLSCDQVRVHVIEARKLIGGQLNATVKIVCGGDIKESATKKGSNNPFWDQVREREEREGGVLQCTLSSIQMLYFHSKDRPQAVFDQVLEIKVLNAKVVLKDALIGSFKVSSHLRSGEKGAYRVKGSSPLRWMLVQCTMNQNIALFTSGFF